MSEDTLTAHVTIEINSSRREVWDALVNPVAIKQYMFGREVESGWREGSDISWKGMFQGKKFADKGVILKIEPEKTFQYSHFSTMSGKPDIPENYHTITIHLADGADKTEISLSQNNVADESTRIELEENWGFMLEGLKKYVEVV